MPLPDGCATSQGRSTPGAGVVRNGRNADKNPAIATVSRVNQQAENPKN
jgi:hypothetical protein